MFGLFERLTTAFSSEASKSEVLRAYAELQILQMRFCRGFIIYVGLAEKENVGIFVQLIEIYLVPPYMFYIFER